MSRTLPLFIVVIALVSIAGCSRQDTGDGASSSSAGIDVRVGLGPELDPNVPLTTPAGRQVLPGTVDDKGYTLPVDIKRPKPARELPPPPTRSDILARRQAVRGGPFTEVRLGPDDGHTQNETSIDADGATLVTGWHSYTDSGIGMGYATSLDAGESWTEGLFTGLDVISDPTVAAAGGGHWFFGYLGSPGSGGNDIDIYVRKSTDNGLTWGAQVDASGTTSFDDKPYIDASGDEVLVGWADFGFSPAKLSASNSIDGGVTYVNRTVLASNSVGGNGACPVIHEDGTYYMFWRDSFQESLWVASSTDQGTSWSTDRGITPMDPLSTPQPGGFRMVNLPSADSDPLTGNLVVVWNDEKFGNADILSVRSTDGGATWSDAIKLNDDTGAAAQYFPWIDFDENGVGHVVWYDRRENGFDLDVYVAQTFDGGNTFGPNIRVTAQPFEPILPWDALAFIGDYNGIAASSTGVYPHYQDAREGNQDVWVALLPPATTGIKGAIAATSAPPTLLRAAPTPFAQSTTLRLEGGGAGRLEIVSVEGRRVRALELDASGAATWDGHDDAGREVARGIYFGRVTGHPDAVVRLIKR